MILEKFTIFLIASSVNNDDFLVSKLPIISSVKIVSVDEIAQASKRYQEVQEALDEAEMRWLELSEIE